MNHKLWFWIPTLYFAEGIPYFIVNNISVTMFTKMGVPNGEMALFTSLLYLPWTIKPLWSPFVDIIRTKRWWILAMQLVMSAAFILTTPARATHIVGGNLGYTYVGETAPGSQTYSAWRAFIGRCLCPTAMGEG